MKTQMNQIVLKCLTTLLLTTIVGPALAGETGGGSTGGGTTIGSRPAEDVMPEMNMKGTKRIPVAEIEALTAPYLLDLDKKLPGFAKALRKGLTDIPWYTDTKPFNLIGCADQSMFEYKQEPQACQDDESIRIKFSFYEGYAKYLKHPTPGAVAQYLPDIAMHELVVHYFKITPVSTHVMRVSKALREMNSSADELNQLIAAIYGYIRKPFGTFAEINALDNETRQIICPIQPETITDEQYHAAIDSLLQIGQESIGYAGILDERGEGERYIRPSMDLNNSGWARTPEFVKVVGKLKAQFHCPL